MSDDYIYLSSEDLSFLVSLTQKHTVLLPSLSDNNLDSENRIILKLYDLLRDKIIQYAKRGSGYQINPQYQKIIAGINEAKCFAKITSVGCVDLYLYIGDDCVILVEPVSVRDNTFRLCQTNIDSAMHFLSEKGYLIEDSCCDCFGRESKSGMQQFVPEDFIASDYLMTDFDDIEFEIKMYCESRVKKIAVAKHHLEYVMLIVQDNSVVRLHYSKELLIEKIKNEWRDNAV